VKRHLLGACAALLLLAPATEAAAKTIHIAAQGTVLFGSDGAGLFGAGADLAGQAFTFSADFDLSKGTYLEYGGFRTDLFGGEAYSGLPGPHPSMGDGVFTLNGHDHVIHGSWNTLLLAYKDANYNFDHQFVQEITEAGGVRVNQAVLLNETPGFGFFGPDYQPPAGNLCAGVHTCDTGNFSYGVFTDGALTAVTFAQLGATSITITTLPDPVPEPSAWALMIGGLALAGAALRRREQTAA